MKNKKQLSRRDFIKLTSLVSASASLPIALSGFSVFAKNKPSGLNFEQNNDNILILVQLQGGNDGLNTIFDLNQYDNLQSVRSNIIIPEADLIALNEETSLHPIMTGMQTMWNQERLGIVQNVGYPNQNRSHFRSTDIWNSASSSEEYVSSGWLGRFFDINHPDFPTGYPNIENTDPFSITLGNIISETCQGPNANFSMAVSDPSDPGSVNGFTTGDIPSNCYGDALTYINNTVSQTNAYGSVIENAYNAGNNLSTNYPNTTNRKISGQLRNVARLISGGLQTKVYIVQLGGFDLHNDQVFDGAPASGRHSALLNDLSEAIAAFQEDLELLGVSERVAGMTYSEFGRKIRSNGSLGTDHGNATPVFLFGDCIKKQILGDAPEIDTEVSPHEGVQMQYDFRNIYSTILTNWLGATEAEATTTLFDDFSALPLFKESCNGTVSTDDFILDGFTINVYPNPTSGTVSIRFLGNNEYVKITLFNTIGAVVKEITNAKYSSVEHTITTDIQHLPSGNYFVLFQSKGISKTKKIIKY